MRRITVISDRKNEPQVFQSSAATWGEFKSTVEKNFGDVSTLRAVEGVNRTTLEMDESRLPDGDFKIYLSQTKIKAGVDN